MDYTYFMKIISHCLAPALYKYSNILNLIIIYARNYWDWILHKDNIKSEIEMLKEGGQ